MNNTMTHEEEHLQDSHIDTWQQAEADQFLRHEREQAVYDREVEEREARAAGWNPVASLDAFLKELDDELPDEPPF